MSSLKTLQDELREFTQKKTVRIKRRLSEDVSVTPPFEAGRNYFKSPMQSLNKTLFPSNARENPTRFPPAVQIIGYQKARPSVSVVVPRAFPNCVNTWHHNFFPAGAERARHKIFLCCQLRLIEHAKQTRKLNLKAMSLKTL